MLEPTYLSREQIEIARGGRGFEAAAPGLWCWGDLAGLAMPCVAVVGTRSATPYGRRLARRFGAELGRAGCCVVSGLALGVDAAAHEGALDAGAPTVGVLGSGHRHFFPPRNAGLAERLISGGGAVLSPYPPDQMAHPWQFLARNGIVAALADAVLVVEAPARSGALNTAGWAAGRIPVLAVPGDVDRRTWQAASRSSATARRWRAGRRTSSRRSGGWPSRLRPRGSPGLRIRLRRGCWTRSRPGLRTSTSSSPRAAFRPARRSPR